METQERVCGLTNLITSNPILLKIVQKFIFICEFDEKMIDCIAHFIFGTIIHDTT
jgi:hypothetical protein